MTSTPSVPSKLFLHLRPKGGLLWFLRSRFWFQTPGVAVFPAQWTQYYDTLFHAVCEVLRNTYLRWFHFVCTILLQKVRFAGMPGSSLPNFSPVLPFWLLQFHLLYCSCTFPPCSFCSIRVFSTVQFALLEYFVHFILLHEHCFKKTGDYLGLTFFFCLSQTSLFPENLQSVKPRVRAESDEPKAP